MPAKKKDDMLFLTWLNGKKVKRPSSGPKGPKAKKKSDTLHLTWHNGKRVKPKGRSGGR